GNSGKGPFRKAEVYVFQVKQLLVLTNESVLRFSQNTYERLLLKFFKSCKHGKTPNKLRDHSEFQKIFRLHFRKQGAAATVIHFFHVGSESKTFSTDSAPDNIL